MVVGVSASKIVMEETVWGLARFGQKLQGVRSYKEVLAHSLIAARNPTFGVHDLIELHHSGGKERLTPL